MAMKYLFSRARVFDVLERQRLALKSEVEGLGPDALEGSSQQEIVHALSTKYKIEVPVLEEDKAQVSHREVDVDVSQDPMRLILDRSQPFYLKGVQITFNVPFRGHPNFFQIQPSTFNLNPPSGQIRDREILLVYTRTDNDAAAVRSEYDQTLRSIKQHLDWLRASAEEFNTKIGSQVEVLVSQRRQQLKAAAGMVAAIGLPVKSGHINTEQPDRLETRQVEKSIASSKKWDVFISHASEDKNEIARPLAEALQKKGLSVWYDDFSLKIGDSLRAAIDYGLVNSRYGVVILSKNFFAKHWPVQELNGLVSREKNSRKVILPIWHKVTADEVRDFSPILADRLAAQSEQGLGTLVEQIAYALEQD
jgi:TIR domain-containing protein